MDPLSGLLDHPRARGAFTLRVAMDPPWSIDVRDEAALTLVVALDGAARLRADGRDLMLAPGDVAVVRGPEPYLVEHLGPDLGGSAPCSTGETGMASAASADRATAATPAPVTTAVIGPDQTCSTPDGAELHLALSRGTRTWGNAADGADSLLVAAYRGTGEVGRLVMEALPRIAHLPASAGLDPALVTLLTTEVARDALGQATVLDRLVDVVLVTAVRAWLAAHPEAAPGWSTAVSDPVVDLALQAIHDRPAQSWTVESLAREANVSRATLAARFRTHVGSPPMAYLTRWRLTLAADLLTTTDRPLASIAGDVGYGSPFSLSAAFSQLMGTSPTAYRRHGSQPAGRG